MLLAITTTIRKTVVIGSDLAILSFMKIVAALPFKAKLEFDCTAEQR